MKVKKYLWAYPKNKTIYVLFDLNNGNVDSVRYLWWYDTYKEAMKHRKEQKKMKHGADLSMPVKVRLETKLTKGEKN